MSGQSERLGLEQYKANSTLLVGAQRGMLLAEVQASSAYRSTRTVARVFTVLGEVALWLGLFAVGALLIFACTYRSFGFSRGAANIVVPGLAIAVGVLWNALVSIGIGKVIHALADIGDTNLEILHDHLVARHRAAAESRDTQSAVP